ncbi:DUF2442 domain-containing protein [Ammoniphilus resinae]|uniref:DUF2442 domain-containing protein n=1 Tax=Ammoniphilus resinae TaxID=861532 RepID=A0ABS4GSY0_9BACL|nr:DUF2442 domain-containing protein [Ammoniphilus resinae]MBP1933237.1 hypothetical protein [Ammoniphilus resinae]
MVLVNKAVPIPGLDGRLFVHFDNGEQKFVNINPHMDGVLDILKNPEFFRKVYVDEELRTVTWPGELDLDPDSLYEEGIGIKEIESIIKAAKTPQFNEFLERA